MTSIWPTVVLQEIEKKRESRTATSAASQADERLSGSASVSQQHSSTSPFNHHTAARTSTQTLAVGKHGSLASNHGLLFSKIAFPDLAELGLLRAYWPPMTHRARVENLAEKNMSIELIEEVQNGEDSFKVVVKYTETGKNDRIVIEGPSCSDPLEALKKGGEKAGAEMDVEMRNYLDNMDMSGWD